MESRVKPSLTSPGRGTPRIRDQAPEGKQAATFRHGPRDADGSDPTLKHIAALRAEELRPARRIADFFHCSLIRRHLALDNCGTPTQLASAYRRGIDAEPNRSEWLHPVVHVGRNGLETTSSHNDVQRRRGRRREP